MSKQKQLVLSVLRDSEGHMTAQQVFEKARNKMPNIALGTVYRNLQILSKDGSIRCFPSFDGTMIYDKTCDIHAHMVCSCCGKINDIFNLSVVEDIERDHNINVDDCSITVYYRCKECN